jgi:heat shock protein HtpX
MAVTACPNCGYENPAQAAYCNLCQTIFVVKPKTVRLQRRLSRRRNFYEQIAINRRNSTLLLMILCAVVLALGYIAGWLYELEHGLADSTARWVGTASALTVALIAVGLVMRRAPDLLLDAVHAREATKAEQPVLVNVVEEMSIAAGMPAPKIYLIENRSPNAMAIGWRPDRSAVAVTRGLVDLLSRDELQGVIAHEIGHIRNRDTQYATLVSVVVGGVTLFCDRMFRPRRQLAAATVAGLFRGLLFLGLVALATIFVALAPLFSRLVQMAVSRQREFLADATAVELARLPGPLADALEKIEQNKSPFGLENRALQHLFIVNPLRTFEMASGALLSTHPPTEARIRILRSMAS